MQSLIVRAIFFAAYFSSIVYIELVYSLSLSCSLSLALSLSCSLFFSLSFFLSLSLSLSFSLSFFLSFFHLFALVFPLAFLNPLTLSSPFTQLFFLQWNFIDLYPVLPAADLSAQNSSHKRAIFAALQATTSPLPASQRAETLRKEIDYMIPNNSPLTA